MAVFLPLHFLALALSLEAVRFEAFLRWTDVPVVKLAEAGLVFALAVHFLGGLRILFVENFEWRSNQLRVATAAGGVAAMVGFAFLLRVL
ncbi:succinate dehydrogenase, cytochrome b subunit [Methylobacterium sp. J-090]|uniref:succinate dehydrogenase, cytochrome b subunit n=1 Tax=Methylobacterium sp. J-090 TaxID=2836666 RepID=UPI001FBB97EA|nr:succinate dehydrogenase, cytochrome b subunit [Methylobacterium sp. J-090]